MKQYIIAPCQLSALENILESERGKAAGFVRDAIAYLRFDAATLYYLPRSESERREFLRLANKAGFTPPETNFMVDLTTLKQRATIYPSNKRNRTKQRG